MTVPIAAPGRIDHPAPGAASSWVDRVDALPPLPEAITAVLQALNQEALSARRCIALIEQDQALAASTLRLANSAFYGAPGRVASIADAVRMLGLRTVAGVLTAAALHHSIRVTACAAFSFPHYWRHAVTTALVARALAPAAQLDADEAFLAGLLHDVGQLLLAAFHPREAEQAMAMARDHGLTAEAAEQDALGVNHAQIGALVAQRWHFPPAIVAAIAQHHQGAAAGLGQRLSLASLVQAAEACACTLMVGDTPDPGPGPCAPPPSDALWLTLGLTPDAAGQLLDGVRGNALALFDSLCSA